MVQGGHAQAGQAPSLEEGGVMGHQPKHISMMKSFIAACFYGFTSISITFFNKAVLSVYKFRYSNTMTLGQMVCSIVILDVLKAAGLVQYPKFSRENARKLVPLTFSFILMVVTGLASLRLVNVPMFSVLRRGTTLLVMIAEYYMMNKVEKPRVRLAVFVMVFGAIVAAAYDLTFDPWGYILTLINCALTAMYLVYVAKMSKTTGLNTFALLYYTNVLSIPFMALLVVATGEAAELPSFPHLADLGFQFCFLMSAVQAVLLNYSIFYCTNINSALTTSCVGHLKNILTTILGFMLFDDVKFDWLNVLGLTVSSYGGTWYAWLKYAETRENNRQVAAQEARDREEKSAREPPFREGFAAAFDMEDEKRDK